jgi:circadian clock protein KaiB
VKTNKTRRAPREITSAACPAPPDAYSTGRASAPPISRGKTQAFEKALATRPTGKYVLRLYVAGATARSRQAVLRIRQLCGAELKDNCELEVIDIYQQPNLARDNQIVATPTLVKEFPRPVRRFIGNLLNTTGLFVELDLITKGKIAL